MGKRAIFSFILSIIMIFGLATLSAQINAAEGDNAKVDKAYQCLKDSIDDSARISFSESVFGVMALGRYGGLMNNISKEKHPTFDCWPSSECKLKETAQVLLAYDRAGQNTDNIEKWIISKNATANDLAWFIEIDTEGQKPSACSIKWEGGQGSVNIDSSMRISGNPGNCLRLSSSGYLLRIVDSCIEKRFDISCNESFFTTLLYQKNNGDLSDCLSGNGKTCYVTGDTNAAASLGTTSEKVVASCFKNGNTCNYEGSLWAATALAQTGNNIDAYVPYLLALAEDNGRYFPDAFLYALISDGNSYSKITELRKSGSYWEIAGSPYNRFYDTSLGMLGLGDSANSNELDKTKEYLLGIQTKEGCWNNNNIKDTAFILYSGWKRGASGGSGSNTGGLADCLSVANADYSCENRQECNNAGGQVLENFFCSGVAKCCTVKVPLKSCTDLGGIVCGQGKECSQSAQLSSNGACCLGACEEVEVLQTCQDRGGSCKASCSGGESEISSSCSASADVCCVQNESSGVGAGWIILLIILILLLGAAIVFRHQLQLWWFNLTKKGGSKGGVSTVAGGNGRPLPPRPVMPIRRAMPSIRPLPPRPVAKPIPKVNGRSSPDKNKELEDTLKKLRDIGK